MGYRLGVDLGTTWTAAAVFDGDRPTMVGLGNRALQIPSVVFVPSAGEVLVGEAAERRAVAEPGRVAREFKRRMADPIPLYIDGRPYSPRALTAELLRWVVARASERLGARPAELTLTYPANWGSYRRGLLDEVCASAGLDGLAVTYRTEPEAAAAQYVYRSAAGAEGSLLVYDLGGGTFDVCVLEAQDGTYSIVGQPAGLDDLGGIDFDEMIFARVIERHAPEDLDIADPATVAALNRLRARVHRGQGGPLLRHRRDHPRHPPRRRHQLPASSPGVRGDDPAGDPQDGGAHPERHQGQWHRSVGASGDRPGGRFVAHPAGLRAPVPRARCARRRRHPSQARRRARGRPTPAERRDGPAVTAPSGQPTGSPEAV